MGSDSNKEYSVNWKNHMSHVRDAFTHLRTSNELTDVTLYCEGQKIGAHKMLLSACSLYFRNTFKELDCQHPVIVMYGVEFCVLSNILQFIYNGEVNVDTTKLDSFLKVAQLLQICGLTDKPSEKRSNESETITEENPNEAFIETNPVPSSSEATSRGVKRIRTEEIEPVKEEVERPENDTLFITDSIKCEPTEVSRIDDPLEEADPLSHTDQSQDAIELFGSTNSQGIGDKEFKNVTATKTRVGKSITIEKIEKKKKQNYVEFNPPQPTVHENNTKRARCAICPRNFDGTATITCGECKQFICSRHC